MFATEKENYQHAEVVKVVDTLFQHDEHVHWCNGKHTSFSGVVMGRIPYVQFDCRVIGQLIGTISQRLSVRVRPLNKLVEIVTENVSE